MKIAASLDGKTALANGKSQWITGAAARRDGHHWRARACAVLTGIGTVRDDDPQLTVREVATPRQPLRVVIDSRLEIPLTARILAGGGVLIACAVEDKMKIGRLQDQGAEVIVLPDLSNAAPGKVDLPGLLQELGRREINEAHVEAGYKLNGSLLNAGCVDELLLYFAPCLLGDRARGMADLPELADLNERRALKINDMCAVGSDIRVMARLEPR
jgi:diaminohydroxyphosphoribosylaminopyrimidine deaminase/5-amino-6-(5-phosphoribosylamino)uracil reductase